MKRHKNCEDNTRFKLWPTLKRYSAKPVIMLYLLQLCRWLFRRALSVQWPWVVGPPAGRGREEEKRADCSLCDDPRVPPMRRCMCPLLLQVRGNKGKSDIWEPGSKRLHYIQFITLLLTGKQRYWFNLQIKACLASFRQCCLSTSAYL